MYNLTKLTTCLSKVTARVPCWDQIYIAVSPDPQPIQQCPLHHFPIVSTSPCPTVGLELVGFLPNLKEEWLILRQWEDWRMWQKLIRSNCGKNYWPPLMFFSFRWMNEKTQLHIQDQITKSWPTSMSRSGWPPLSTVSRFCFGSSPLDSNLEHWSNSVSVSQISQRRSHLSIIFDTMAVRLTLSKCWGDTAL